jgi:hypothetical protein
MITLYLLAIIALIVSAGALYLPLIKSLPVQLNYYHYHIRKPLTWSILIATLLWVAWQAYSAGSASYLQEASAPLALMGLSVILAYRMHQEVVFSPVDFPAMSEDPLQLPLAEDAQMAVIEYGGETKAFPLDYVVHHHIINDHFGDYLVSLTYCAMCRSVIPFDVTDIGPLFGASLKNANMIVADKRTKTFFQQASFESLIGPLHPHSLTMLPFQILPWSEVNQLRPLPNVPCVTENDLRKFELPIRGIWNKLLASEITPGLSAKERDKSFPARTRVIGIVDSNVAKQVVYVKSELIQAKLVRSDEANVFFVASGDTVNAFKCDAGKVPIDLTLGKDSTLTDKCSGTSWNIRGKYLNGAIESDLEIIAISDEYWFSWKLFHPNSLLIRLV